MIQGHHQAKYQGRPQAFGARVLKSDLTLFRSSSRYRCGLSPHPLDSPSGKQSTCDECFKLVGGR